MLILPALFTLFTYLYWRPHTIFEVLHPVTVNAVLAFVAFTFAIDFRTGWTRPRVSPLIILLFCFVIWAFVTVLVKAPDRLGDQFAVLLMPLLTLVFVSEGVQSIRALQVVGNVLMVFSIGLAILGVEQGLAPTACYVREDSTLSDTVVPGFDGRDCTDRKQCYQGGLPGAEYSCEHPGWVGTSSVGGRVRYLGMLEDPNELAWALAMGLPFIFSFYERRRSAFRLVFLFAAIGVITACVVMTQSRSGQLSLLGALGVYFIRRYRWRGVVGALVLGLPVLLLGGRSGEEAESSSHERLVCWQEGLSMWRENPLIGVGSGQFTQHHVQTAHSAFVLSGAELGPLGLLLFSSALYYAVKILVRMQIELRDRPEAQDVLSFSVALLASQVALLVSAFFLSLPYHPILWIFIGLTGALYAVAQRHAPEFKVRFGARDLAFLAAFDTVLIASIAVYIRLKGV
ncbi:MAG TPA: O-antigen ligase family protein [Polyangia bacterium]|nr:O-antigen ligase family protein [Polyangia bacterium]